MIATSHLDDMHIPLFVIDHHVGVLIYSVDVHLKDLTQRTEDFCMCSETLGEGHSTSISWCDTPLSPNQSLQQNIHALYVVLHMSSLSLSPQDKGIHRRSVYPLATEVTHHLTHG